MEILHKYIRLKYLIIMDTSFALSHNIATFYQKNLSCLKREKVRLVIPRDVLNEIEKVKVESKLKGDKRKLERIAEFNFIYNQLKKDSLVIITKEYKNKNHVDNILLSKVLELRTKRNILLLTNDKGLREDVLKLKNSKSTFGIKDIAVFGDNKFQKKSIEKKIVDDKSFHIIKDTENKKNIYVNNKVDILCNKPSYTENKLNQSLPKLNKIASGGEGDIYLGNNQVFKVYRKKQLDSSLEDKLKLLINCGKKIKDNHIIFPKNLIYNKYNQCIGYTMEFLDKVVTMQKYLSDINLKNIIVKKTDLITICQNIITLSKKLHKNSIFVGDWNMKNILINPNTKKVYLIDIDSYQVKDYICPVGLMEFTDHKFLELTNGKFSNYFRNEANEVFSLNIIIFQILMLGQKPYTRKNNEAVNYKNRVFPYKFSSSGSLAPNGAWSKIWDNLTYRLKDAFFDTFTSENRYSLDWWNFILNGYKIEIEKNNLTNSVIPEKMKSK